MDTYQIYAILVSPALRHDYHGYSRKIFILIVVTDQLRWDSSFREIPTSRDPIATYLSNTDLLYHNPGHVEYHRSLCTSDQVSIDTGISLAVYLG